MKMITKASICSITVGSIATLALAFSPIQPAQAAIITSLYNTGVDGSGNVLADGIVGDPHYSLVSSPIGATATRVTTSATHPFDDAIHYVGDDLLSRWITPNTIDLTGPDGDYKYQTKFNLTGFDPKTAKITGKWAADDQGFEIWLNGVKTSVVTTDGNKWGQWNDFGTISSGFIAGENTLDFIVKNATSQPGVTGLRVEMSGTANAAVPEPSDLMGSAIAFGSVVLLKRKLSKKTLG
jgi:hypothetical protein